MKIRNPELIGDIAVLFLTVGIFSWGFYNLGARNGSRAYSSKQIEVLRWNDRLVKKYIEQDINRDSRLRKQLDEINKKLDSLVDKL